MTALPQPELVHAAHLERVASLPDAEIQRLTDYLMAAIFALRGRRDHQVAALVIQKAVPGEPFHLGSKELEKTFGMGRRSAWRAIVRLLSMRFIAQVGVAPDDRPLYRICLERADEYRAHLATLEEARHAA